MKVMITATAIHAALYTRLLLNIYFNACHLFNHIALYLPLLLYIFK